MIFASREVPLGLGQEAGGALEGCVGGGALDGGVGGGVEVGGVGTAEVTVPGLH